MILLKRIVDFQSDIKRVSLLAYKSFSKHLWYLSQPATAFVFFGPRICLEEKIKMVKALRKSSTTSYLNKITIEKKKVHSKSISDFVSEKTLQFMIDFGFKLTWLADCPKSWAKNNDFISDRSILQSIQVVNDCAEGAIKLVQEYTWNRTRTESDLQNLLLTVDHHRKIFPNRSKISVSSKQTMVAGNFIS